MFKKLKTYLLFGNSYCGIEHTSKATIEAILLEKKKNEVTIHDSFDAKTIAEIAQKLPKKQHVFLVVNNTEVLNKFVESNEKQPNRLLFEAFPNLAINDFYYEISNRTTIGSTIKPN